MSNNDTQGNILTSTFQIKEGMSEEVSFVFFDYAYLVNKGWQNILDKEKKIKF